MSSGKFCFPHILSVTLKSFSLYSSVGEIRENVTKPVFCLMGANGIGKSTFLAAVNYGLTGIVPDPTRDFKDLEDFYEKNLGFSDDYFDGRVKEKDRQLAEITIDLRINDTEFSLTRGFFEPQSLRAFRKGKQKASKSDHLSSKELHVKYTKELIESIGLETFEQFVFLQLFAFTFDERRITLFWGPEILNRVLHLSFGLDPSDAKKADSLMAEVKSADTNYKQASYTISQLVTRVKELQAASKNKANQTVPEKRLQDQHETLTQDLEKIQAEITKFEVELKDASVSLANHSAKHAALRNAYSAAFNARFEGQAGITYHPIIQASLLNGRCELCGNSDAQAVLKIKALTSTEKCPLCENHLEHKKDDKLKLDELKKIDAKLGEVQKSVDDAVQRVSRLTTTLEAGRARLLQKQAQLVEFERANADFISQLKKIPKGDGIAELIKAFQTQIQDLETRKAGEYKERERLKKKLEPLEQKLRKQYLIAEKKFVPIFKDLAHSFLGLDLDISLDTKKNKISFSLEVKDNQRRRYFQLSESQRFFLDIALRMALANFMSDDKGKACLLLDTPEGSLDIAYETRAGEMLSKFVERNHQLILTANVNSSKLTLRLAERCKAKGMQLCRMTNWSELSEVQIEEAGSFESAFRTIETALGLDPK